MKVFFLLALALVSLRAQTGVEARFTQALVMGDLKTAETLSRELPAVVSLSESLARAMGWTMPERFPLGHHVSASSQQQVPFEAI